MLKKKLAELYFEEEELLFTAAAQIQLQLSEDRRRRRRKRGLSGLDVGYNVDSSTVSMSISKLIREDERSFRNYTTICPELYQELAERVGPRLLKKDTFK